MSEMGPDAFLDPSQLAIADPPNLEPWTSVSISIGVGKGIANKRSKMGRPV